MIAIIFEGIDIAAVQRIHQTCKYYVSESKLSPFPPSLSFTLYSLSQLSNSFYILYTRGKENKLNIAFPNCDRLPYLPINGFFMCSLNVRSAFVPTGAIGWDTNYLLDRDSLLPILKSVMSIVTDCHTHHY